MTPTPSLLELVPTGLIVTFLVTVCAAAYLVISIVKSRSGLFPHSFYAVALLPALSGIAFGFHSFSERLLYAGVSGFIHIETTAAYFWLPKNGAFISLAFLALGMVLNFWSERIKR